ncbi:integrase arm-type DNA-binding domain-containing protein [Bradyrhizobium sp. AUGA SZCCT0182]|uniref:integrase arm-type DNA-binding domain-containing protein n=1 Tax=Bradyrhizobium sp. AUGA SZCCT0182 TaxID=2807667 RepID=UPI001BA67F95|nr:integrase arm-type DNA-binding domain-containing protein [Bradyrhizobium sp. AUGA SZCCT0182]MBR1232053.1 hypothetical protein [Bradyrhizobium sp. AUGA SZCCT0182]
MAGDLTAQKVETAKQGKYSDGGNLYLILSETAARKSMRRFTWRGKAKEMGLRSATSVPLADARERAASARRRIAQGSSVYFRETILAEDQIGLRSHRRCAAPADREYCGGWRYIIEPMRSASPHVCSASEADHG